MTKVAIIGGGLSGLTLAYHLSKAGLQVTIYEQANSPGGLAINIDYKGWRMDKFYHTILSSDMSMQSLIEATGVKDKLHFVSTKQGFYDAGKLYPFNTPIDLMTYPPLNVFQRFRLGLQIIYAQLDSNWRKMDTIPVKNWLLKVSGRGAYDKVWEPLLRAKFDNYDVSSIPATYIWSRLRRMLSTRQGATSKEMMCYLEGGYYTLIDALAKQCEVQGVTFKLSTSVQEIVIEQNVVVGIQVNGSVEPCDAVISTLSSPILARLAPGADENFRTKLLSQEHLSILCPMLILKKSLIPYYVINITDKTIPFTAVVETTNLFDPQYLGGYHLVYLPKYLSPNSPLAKWDDERIEQEWMTHFKRMFPDFDTSQIEAFLVHRAMNVEPIRPLGTSEDIPAITTPVKNLFMSNSAMVHPELNNGESVTTLAKRVAETVLQALINRTSEAVVIS